MIQRVTDNTRFRGENKPSWWLNVLFNKRINLEIDINYECPFGRSEHMVLEIEIKGNIEDKQDVQEKYDLFLMIYDQGVKEYVPFYKVKEKGKKRVFERYMWKS